MRRPPSSVLQPPSSILRIDRHPILTFENSGPVGFFFEGRPMTGRRGETIAAALAANGVRLFRHAEKTGRPRGFFCAVGKCASCLMVVDGKPNTMVCVEPLREGVKVERQRGRGKLGGLSPHGDCPQDPTRP
jgi:sarcosine oxidase subunit alpha